MAIERADLLSRLEAVARTDDLTGLANRRAWDEHLPRELARAGRDGRPLCVAMLDLDRFKEYNDERGHQAGDRLLKQVSGAWREMLRPSDMLARYGGEEFSSVLPNCPIEKGLEVVERLREYMVAGQTCSAGIAAGTARRSRMRWFAAPTRRSTRPRRPAATGPSPRARALQYPGWDSNPHGPKATAF